MSILLRHLVFLTLKLMGIKRDFSQDPIDYQKIRKSDQKQASKSFRKTFKVNEERIADSMIISISPKNHSPVAKHIIYIPGGAFISGPAPHHWDILNGVISQTNASAWLIDYPKAPESNIHQLSANIDAIYHAAIEQFPSDQLILIGDSVGANLILTLIQRLANKKALMPKKLILITPVFDSSMSNAKIDSIDKKDPMLSKAGVLSAKMMCAQGIDLKSPLISPIYGNFTGFPMTTVFLGGRDIMYPDGLLAIAKMKEADVSVEVINEEEMPHIYPLLPLMTEARVARSRIVDIIKNS